jgi:hypothetical protein
MRPHKVYYVSAQTTGDEGSAEPFFTNNFSRNYRTFQKLYEYLLHSIVFSLVAVTTNYHNEKFTIQCSRM